MHVDSKKKNHIFLGGYITFKEDSSNYSMMCAWLHFYIFACSLSDIDLPFEPPPPTLTSLELICFTADLILTHLLKC